MNVKLTIGERFKDERVNKGLSLDRLAEETKLSRSALSRYESDTPGDISPYSLSVLAKFYNVSMEYLMGLTEQRNPPLTPIEELHISDSLIALLKGGRINNRLLSEIASHEAFPRLMVDMEIYIDRLVQLKIQDINTVLWETRELVRSQYNPSEDELQFRTLEVGQIDEGRYLLDIILSDLERILSDIRERHKKDTDAVPMESVSEQFIH